MTLSYVLIGWLGQQPACASQWFLVALCRELLANCHLALDITKGGQSLQVVIGLHGKP
jgi:hypothetical protein